MAYKEKYIIETLSIMVYGKVGYHIRLHLPYLWFMIESSRICKGMIFVSEWDFNIFA